jgi:hypothetical protein
MIVSYSGFLRVDIDEKKLEISNIQCSLPVVGEGNTRICYLLPDNKILKVAKDYDGTLANLWEINLYNKIKNEDCIIKVPKIYEYEDTMSLYYICDKINMNYEALQTATEIIPILDQMDGNVGYDSKGQLTVTDAENIHYSWFLRSENPYKPKQGMF